jgi:hypothetical protein
MPNYICVTCGTQYAESSQPPAHCPICEDERQYLGANGQEWTTLDALQADRKMVIEPQEVNLYRLKPEPKIGIGQYAYLVQTPNGNVLWDCVPYLDDDTADVINSLGGIAAIAISHPHFHTIMVEWSRAFNAPVYIHEGNRRDVVRPDAALHFWSGATQPIIDGVTAVHCGGHFEGSALLHWRDGADGRGVLLTADTMDVVADTRWVTFMYSYPNYIPLRPSKVRKIVAAAAPFAYDRMYDGFGGVMDGDAKSKVARSADRYIAAMQD